MHFTMKVRRKIVKLNHQDGNSMDRMELNQPESRLALTSKFGADQ